MEPIAQIQIRRVAKLLEERGIRLDIGADAIAWLAARGFDPAYGARPLRRVVQRDLQDPLAELVLRAPPVPGSTVRVSRSGDALAFEVM